jgi:hypothetical protein
MTLIDTARRELRRHPVQIQRRRGALRFETRLSHGELALLDQSVLGQLEQRIGATLEPIEVPRQSGPALQ